MREVGDILLEIYFVFVYLILVRIIFWFRGMFVGLRGCKRFGIIFVILCLFVLIEFKVVLKKNL